MRREIKPRKEGDTRIKSRFLVLPKIIGHELRWLERATWEEELLDDDEGWYWLPTRWINEN